MKVQDGTVHMDLRESMRDSVKVFCEGLRVQLVKLFCLETFMVYGIWEIFCLYIQVTDMTGINSC